MEFVDDEKLGAITSTTRDRDAVKTEQNKTKQLILKTLVTESTSNSMQQEQWPLTGAPALTQAHRWDGQGKKDAGMLFYPQHTEQMQTYNVWQK